MRDPTAQRISTTDCIGIGIVFVCKREQTKFVVKEPLVFNDFVKRQDAEIQPLDRQSVASRIKLAQLVGKRQTAKLLEFGKLLFRGGSVGHSPGSKEKF